MVRLLLFGGGWNNHCKRFCGPVMAACLRAKCAAGGHDLPKFRMCYGPSHVTRHALDWDLHKGCGARVGLISGDLTYRQGAGTLVGAVAPAHPAPT